MNDPIGLVGAGGAGPIRPAVRPPSQPGVGAPGFKETLLKSLEQVNAAQQEADRAVEDLVTGKRQDVEGVILATEKADMAFQMLQSVRNKVLSAYEEIKQVRV